MVNVRALRNRAVGTRFGMTLAALAIATLFVTTVGSGAAEAQNFNVIYTFQGFIDGAQPYSGLTIKSGALYGTTHSGNEGTNWGDVFQLRQHNSSWIFNVLHLFDGELEARPVFGPDGTLYGTSPNNISQQIYGYIYNLRPPVSATCSAIRCPWDLNFPYSFAGGADGDSPRFGALVFDHAGNMYGTTAVGGSGNGVVFEVSGSFGSGWTERAIYTFSGPDGAMPSSGVILDSAGNLYGTTTDGGQFNTGTVYELSPNGSGWSEKVLYSFQNGSDGSYPSAGLVLDAAGNLYGATTNGGSGGAGTAFELSPNGNNWNFSLLSSFSGGAYCGPWGDLTFDSAGNLYGTTFCGGSLGFGSVFKLSNSGNGWTYTSMHDFTNGNDGSKPYCNVAFDAAGNMYGSASHGGAQSSGTIWQITPQ